MNKNQVKGRMKQVKAKAKEAFGRMTNDKSLEFKGKATNAAGKLQEQSGDFQKEIEHATDSK